MGVIRVTWSTNFGCSRRSPWASWRSCFRPELSSASANTTSKPTTAARCRFSSSLTSVASQLRPQGQRPTSARLFSSMSTMTMRGSGVLGLVARSRAS